MELLLGKRKVKEGGREESDEDRLEERKDERKEGREVQREGRKKERKISVCVLDQYTFYIKLTLFFIIFIKKQNVGNTKIYFFTIFLTTIKHNFIIIFLMFIYVLI